MSTDKNKPQTSLEANAAAENPSGAKADIEKAKASADSAAGESVKGSTNAPENGSTGATVATSDAAGTTVGTIKHTASKVAARISKAAESIDNQDDYPDYPRWLRLTMRWSVCILSVVLIVYISIETFRKIPFLENTRYMYFQLFVCIVFMTDFFIELHYSRDRKRYWKYHWLFLVLSFPWLNVVVLTSITLSPTAYYYARFIPLARGALALALVSSYISKNRIGGLLMAYLTIMIMVVYFGSLIFYTVEAPVNPGVTSYWIALWWAMLESTTYGASIYPVTAIGKLFNFIISAMGIIMFPLLTVYLTTWVKKQVNKTSDEL